MQTENFKPQSSNQRQRSARRLRHEAQIKVFQVQAGGLEDIRGKLGLRPSQICEILKVHPSAWIRWTRTGKAPPHIYQMLDWYLELLKWRGQNILAPVHLPSGAATLGSSERSLVKQDPEIYVPASPLAFGPHPDLTSSVRRENNVGPSGPTKTPTATWILVGVLGLQAILCAVVIMLLLKKY